MKLWGYLRVRDPIRGPQYLPLAASAASVCGDIKIGTLIVSGNLRDALPASAALEAAAEDMRSELQDYSFQDCLHIDSDILENVAFVARSNVEETFYRSYSACSERLGQEPKGRPEYPSKVAAVAEHLQNY